MRLLIIILLALGITFRIVNLDHKIYWYDEAYTSLRASGYTEAEVVTHFSHTSIVHRSDLQQYQHPDPQRGLGRTWHSLATEDPQHPPLYYVLASYWARSVGHSITAMRLLPALLSLLAFPCAYWLCQELLVLSHACRTEMQCASPPIFAEIGMGWMMVGLVAVSPFHLLYAQEAREYSLWSVTALLATATLLRAVRINTASSWLIYALSLTASLYTFLFSIWIATAHGIYVFAIAKFRFNRTIAAYLLATLLAVVTFFPWLWVTVQNLSQIQAVTNWTTDNRSLGSLILSWANMLGRLFYDRGISVVDRAVQVGIILLIGVAFYHLCRHTTKSVWLLIVSLSVVPILVLILPDLILGGARSTSPRYIIPALCGVQLAVAHLLTTKLCNIRWRWIMAMVFTAGILSCWTIAQAETWWIKPHNQENSAVAQMINSIAHPLVISDAETADLLSLSYLLDADTDLLIRPRCYTCSIEYSEEINPAILEIPATYSNVFLFHPRAPKAWKRSLKQMQTCHFEVALPDQTDALWRLSRENCISNNEQAD